MNSLHLLSTRELLKVRKQALFLGLEKEFIRLVEEELENRNANQLVGKNIIKKSM